MCVLDFIAVLFSQIKRSANTLTFHTPGLCKRQKVLVQQEEPYADIYIVRGERFHE